MSSLRRTLVLVWFVLLSGCASASFGGPSKELAKAYQQICDFENNMPDVENERTSDYLKQLEVDNYVQGNIPHQLDRDRRFWRLVPDRDNDDPGVIREKKRVLTDLHRTYGASFETIAALYSTLRGMEQQEAMTKYVRDHPELKYTRYAAWKLQPKAVGKAARGKKSG